MRNYDRVQILSRIRAAVLPIDTPGISVTWMTPASVRVCAVCVCVCYFTYVGLLRQISRFLVIRPKCVA